MIVSSLSRKIILEVTKAKKYHYHSASVRIQTKFPSGYLVIMGNFLK